MTDPETIRAMRLCRCIRVGDMPHEPGCPLAVAKPSLADFLLARIAEDEAASNVTRWGKPYLRPGGVFHVTPSEDLRPRWLAECEAKRRVMEWTFGNAATIDWKWGCCHTSDEIRSGQCPCIDETDETLLPLRLLALPYADHPDYREEWKP